MKLPWVGAPQGRRMLLWGLLSLLATALLGVLLTWGAQGVRGVLPAPQVAPWYDCQAGALRFALQYRLGSDRMLLRWPEGETVQGASYPDRIEWPKPAAPPSARQSAMPTGFVYASSQRLELRNAAQHRVVCAGRSTPATVSTP